MNSEQLVGLLQELQPQRIAIIKPSALGDVVQTLPLVPILQQKYPGVEIDWVIRRELADLLQAQPGLTQIVPYDRRGGLSSSARLLRQLWSRQYDLTLDLQGLLRTAVMTAATRAPLRIGLQTAREGSALACHGLLPGTERSVPAFQRHWRLAEILGLGDQPQQLRLEIPAAVRHSAIQLLSGSRRPMLAIHPGAMWVTKRWPAESFAEVAVRVAERYGWRIVVIGSKGEQAEANFICNALERLAPQSEPLNLAGQTTLQQLAVVLEAATLLLTNDSGPMHLAAGLGTPVVGIFTCTSAERSGPPGSGHELVQAKVPCAASYRKQCPHKGAGHLQCLQALSIHQVWSAVTRAIEKNRLQEKAA